MFYYKHQYADHVKLVKQINENFAQIIENAVPVFQHFDGKVINKRLKTAMDAIMPERYYFSFESYGWLSVSTSRNCIKESVPNHRGEYDWLYTSCDHISFQCDKTEDNRLNAAATIANMRKMFAARLAETEKMQWESDHYDDLKVERDALRQAVAWYENKLSYVSQDLRVKPR